MNKEGLSHIEVILGFVIFMMAIFFLLASYQPLFKNKTGDEQLIQKLYDGFLENNSVEIDEYYIFIKNYSAEKISINLTQNLTNYGLVASNSLGKFYNINPINLEKGTFCLSNILSSDRMIIVKTIKDITIPLSNNPCPDEEENYNISTKFKTSLISIDKLKNFNFSYHANQGMLKSSLDLPRSSEFEYNITVVDSTEFIGDYTGGEDRTNAYSTNRKIKAINQSGSIQDLEVLFRIW